jgi:large subunit ribosomal protein L13
MTTKKRAVIPMTNKTPYYTKSDVEREWYLVDAEDLVLGRLCAGVAKLLIGKHKPTFTPGQDTGAFVVVVNAGKVRLTAGKENKKIYYRHSGYIGGLKSETFAEKLKKSPRKVVMDSVRGMLPQNKLGDRLITKLKVYAGTHHPHQAQQPVVLSREQLGKI